MMLDAPLSQAQHDSHSWRKQLQVLVPNEHDSLTEVACGPVCHSPKRRRNHFLFDWGTDDCPVVSDSGAPPTDMDNEEFLAETKPLEPSCDEANNNNDEYGEVRTVSSSTSATSLLTLSDHQPCSTSSIEKSNRNRRVISFSSTLRVRTHQVILGFHPCCEDGMAMECDWPSVDSVDELLCDDDDDNDRAGFLELEGDEDDDASEASLCLFEVLDEQIAVRRRPTRLTQPERLERLKATTGLSKKELMDKEFDLVMAFYDDNNSASSSVTESADELHESSLRTCGDQLNAQSL